jgi:alpha-glucoside transport system substrate-binding protein
MNDILLGATTFRFDGSDLMPGRRRRRHLLDRHGRLRRRQAAEEVASRSRRAWDALK